MSTESTTERSTQRNKAPAELQISAEQILLEAYENKDIPLNKTNVRVADLEELHELQRRKRKDYEDALRRNRLDFGQWMRYAQFEIDQNEMKRARSIFERALDINSHHVPLWIRYIDSELKTKNINHARNLFDRATTLLPRIDKLWFRYVQTEETLQNPITTRSIFKRWMKWEPNVPAWDAYINFEKRYQEFDNVRKIFNQYVIVHPIVETWLKWTRFEDTYGTPATVREVFTVGIDVLKIKNETLITQFAKWEASQREWERARAIFKFAQLKFPESKVISDELSKFEKQFGDKDGIESSIFNKRKNHYEKELAKDPKDYDTWWAYLSLLSEYSIDIQREAFEKAISNKPDTDNNKTTWKKYLFIWIRYTILEELNNEFDKTRDLFDRLSKILPKSFTISKFWILYSNFEIRQQNLSKARKLLGYSIGAFPKHKTFKHYIELEIKLKEFDRVRKLYEKYLESFPKSVEIWIEFAQLENGLNDIERARAIYELALETFTSSVDIIWQSYIELEVEQREYTNARTLYERQISYDTTSAVLWIKSALFELTIPTQKQLDEYDRKVEESGDDELEFEFEISDDSKSRTRDVFEKALTFFKSKQLSDERILIFEAFKQFEEIHGDEESKSKIERRLPTVVKKIKELEDGSKKEYLDYVFPDDKKFSKFLQNAKLWAKQNK